MSSVERDVAEALLSVYNNAIALNMEGLSKEQLVEHILSEAESAKDEYLKFAVSYGWYDNYDEGNEHLESYKTIEEGFRDCYEDDTPEVFLRIREWLAREKRLDTHVIGKIIADRPKAIQFWDEATRTTHWLPKSQIIETIL